MLLWHAGATVAIARYVFRDERMDLRFLLLGGLVANIVDTPVGLLLYDRLGTVRLLGHSLLVAAAVMVAVLLSTRRGRPRKRWMPIAIGMLLHLVLDAMWGQPETLWWPFFGLDFSPSQGATAGEYIAGVLSDWRVWLLEAAGLAYLVSLGRRAGLENHEARRTFLATGRIDVAIDQR